MIRLAYVALLPLAGWALWRIAGLGGARTIFVWLLAAAVLHDFVLLPAYSALDRLARSRLRGAVNYVRVPASVWLLLGLVYYPVIAGRGEAAFHRVSGLRFEGYLVRWLLSGVVLFSVSGALYLAAARRAGARRSGRRSPPPTPRSAGGSSDTTGPAPDASRPRTPPRD
jgi:hypothetical protein